MPRKKRALLGPMTRKSKNTKRRRAKLKLIDSASGPNVPISVIPGRGDSDLEEEDDPEDLNEGSTSGQGNILDYNDWFGSSEPTYPCPDCAKCFSDTDDLRSHLREYHGVVYSTEEKEKRVKSKEKDKTKEKIKKVLPKGCRQCKECDQM